MPVTGWGFALLLIASMVATLRCWRIWLSLVLRPAGSISSSGNAMVFTHRRLLSVNTQQGQVSGALHRLDHRITPQSF
jgi:hypothetical protein